MVLQVDWMDGWMDGSLGGIKYRAHLNGANNAICDGGCYSLSFSILLNKLPYHISGKCLRLVA